MPVPNDLVDLLLKHGTRDPEAEDRVLREGCAVLDRSACGKLRLTGSERASFLHGQLTADVQALKPGQGAYTTQLTPKGHLIADGRVLARGDHLLFFVEPGREVPVREVLEKHLISEDVEVADVTGTLALLSFLGPKTADVLGLALDEHTQEERNGVLFIGTRLGALPGLDVLLPIERAAAFLEPIIARGANVVGEAAYDLARVEAGIPRFGIDMDEETIPLEANLGDRAISFTKGCYVGQEVIARASFRGGVRHKLFGFRLDPGPLPADGTPLFKAVGDAKPAAELTRAVLSPRFGPIALGYARREHQSAGVALVTAEGRRAVVCALPFA